MSPPGALSPTEKKIQEGWNSLGSKVTWPELKRISICRTRNVDLKWANMRTYNFFVSAGKLTNFLVQLLKDPAW